MSKKMLFAALAACAAAAAAVAAVETAAKPPQADATGHWVGKAKAKEFYLTPDQKNGQDQFDAVADVVQTGSDVTVTLTLTTDEGVTVYDLAGHVGKGTIWASTSAADTAALVSVHIDLRAKQMHGIGIVTNAEESDELKLHLKKT